MIYLIGSAKAAEQYRFEHGPRRGQVRHVSLVRDLLGVSCPAEIVFLHDAWDLAEIRAITAVAERIRAHCGKISSQTGGVSNPQLGSQQGDDDDAVQRTST